MRPDLLDSGKAAVFSLLVSVLWQRATYSWPIGVRLYSSLLSSAEHSLQCPLLPASGAAKPHSDPKSKNALNNAVVKVHQQRYCNFLSLQVSLEIKVLLLFFFKQGISVHISLNVYYWKSEATDWFHLVSDDIGHDLICSSWSPLWVLLFWHHLDVNY